MIKIDVGNTLLKQAHRKQVMAWLKRSVRLGQQIGNFVLTITVQRIGRGYVVSAVVKDQAGEFDCRVRKHEWRDAFRDMGKLLAGRLHEQHLHRVTA